MQAFAFLAGAHLRNALLCAVVAASLAACGGDDAGSGAQATGLQQTSQGTNHFSPTIEGVPAVSVDVGSRYVFLPSATDANGAPLRYSVSNKPLWASFDTGTGMLSGTPSQADIGDTVGISVIVTNGQGQSSIGPFNLRVRPHPGRPLPSPQPTEPVTDSPPLISGVPMSTVIVGQVYSFTPRASDPDGDTLSFTIANRPDWATFDSSTGRLAGIPTVGSEGTFQQIVISVSDGQQVSALPPFSIQVMPPAAHTPSISGMPPTSVVAGQTYTFSPSATDPDGGTLTFEIANEPSWATFNSRTGQLSGTPTVADVGTRAGIVISVTDGQASAELPAFSIQVLASANHPPSISGSPPTSVLAGTEYSFQPSASDADGDPLTFSVKNRPAWATFDAATGRLSGVPSGTQTGKDANIVITVSDGETSVSLPAFTVTVTGSQLAAPSISGAPTASVNVGSAYGFTPSATAPSGTSLTFSIQNKPSWASFNTGTGALTGTPAAGDVGTYANIIISVSDGQASASLSAFTVTVNQISSSSATLEWTPPTENTDGTSLTNLAGYKVYYGTSAGSLSHVVQLANPGLTGYTVSSLSSGTWYFAVTAYTSGGVESSLSPVVSASF
ncbi:MAG TPA: putative Ig domain-containing protein [Steroidobacteraceae bacterium]|nr:putative Ig domain-containing protein [Steroidobacteraceae bacterium]